MIFLRFQNNIFINFLYRFFRLFDKFLLILLFIYDTLYITKIHIKGEPIP